MANTQFRDVDSVWLNEIGLTFDRLSVESETECLSGFYAVVCNAYKLNSYADATAALLSLACRRFEYTKAYVLHPVSESICEVLGFLDPENSVFIGQHMAIDERLCGRILTQNETHVEVNCASLSGQLKSMAYNSTQIGTYLGIEVNSVYFDKCVLCFTSDRTSRECLGPIDKALLKKLAEGIACMIDLQKSQALRKTADISNFAEGSVKTLDEYLEQARLPETLGVPARVLEVLQNRIGQKPLGIAHIADELNLSKRTLQRRLQQQEVNFADLRDQVRFHFSIDYLIKQHMSIDSISSSLDFSDRTSFTNAFKRWTGLSPSTFRKLFRDYV